MKDVAIKIQPYQQDVVQKVQHSSVFRCHPCISQCSDFIERPLKDHLNLSSFTHPNVFPNLYGFLCSVEHKINLNLILKNVWGTKQHRTPLTFIIFF